ncbi:MAG: hypothetical protein V7L31_16315 [Nostoc sp.]
MVEVAENLHSLAVSQLEKLEHQRIVEEVSAVEDSLCGWGIS